MAIPLSNLGRTSDLFYFETPTRWTCIRRASAVPRWILRIFSFFFWVIWIVSVTWNFSVFMSNAKLAVALAFAVLIAPLNSVEREIIVVCLIGAHGGSGVRWHFLRVSRVLHTWKTVNWSG